MVFLHKYNEPVLLLLHETEPTWAGLLRHKHDTMALTALSINTMAQHHPKIWGASRCGACTSIKCSGCFLMLLLHRLHIPCRLNCQL